VGIGENGHRGRSQTGTHFDPQLVEKLIVSAVYRRFSITPQPRLLSEKRSNFNRPRRKEESSSDDKRSGEFDKLAG